MLIATIAAAFVTTVAPGAASDPAPAPAPRVASADANPRVCIVDRITGSMIPVRQCKLLADWRAEGVDPLAKR